MSVIIDKITSMLPSFVTGKGRMDARIVLCLKPVRHPGVPWERAGDDQLVVLTIASRTDPWSKLLARTFGIPNSRKIEMSDELSSLVWELCDGKHSVSEIAVEIARDYKLTRRQAEVSVLAFLRTLQGKRLVGVPSSEVKAIKNNADQKIVSTKKPSLLQKTRSKEAEGAPGFHASRKQRSRKTIVR